MKTLLIIGAVFLGLICIEGLRLILLRQQIGRYKKYWQQQAAKTPQTNALWYVAMGDSAAQGIGASKPTNGYVGLIAQSLAEKTSRPVRVINLSVSGAKLTDALGNQIPQLHKLSLPKDAVVTVEIGANDMGNFKKDTFAIQFEKLVGALPAQSLVANIPYFGGGLFRSREKNVLVANQIIEGLVSKHHLKLVDLHKQTKDHGSIWGFAADWFHPNNRSYKNWYQAFRPLLDAS